MRRLIVIVAVLACAGCGAKNSVVPAAAVAATQTRPLQTGFRVLYSFKGGADGAQPYTGPLTVFDGKLYGTTERGGTSSYGTVFEITADGTERVLHSFAGNKDGRNPKAGMTLLNGVLYGATEHGGDNGERGHDNLGTVFQIKKDGTERVIYYFDGYGGAHPHGALTAEGGVLYGTAYEFGKEYDGTLFSVTTDGKFTVLHSFGRIDRDGAFVEAGPRFFEGKIYGTTLYGPAAEGHGGVVYEAEIQPRVRERLVYRFGKRAGDGLDPYDRVTMFDGILFGTTSIGGKNNEGVVFKLDTNGAQAIIHEFQASTGWYPVAGLTLHNGKFYGQTLKGGRFDKGVIFEIAEDGGYRVLHDFDGKDGAGGASELLAWNGKLYGTTVRGGAKDEGTVFELTP